MIEVLKAFLGGAGGASLVAGLFAVWQWWLKRKAQKEDSQASVNAGRCTARGEEIERLHNEVAVLKEAIGLQFYNDIKRRAKKYIARKCITFEEYEDIQRDYEMYHDEDKLDMNGFLKGIMEEIEHLEKR